MMASPKRTYDEILDLHGIKVPLYADVVTPKIERQMRVGHYEAGESRAARAFVRAGDRVLELGGGLGVISSVVGRIEGVEKVLSIEANPQLIEVIRETQRLNGVDRCEVRHGVIDSHDRDSVAFYVRPDFWASSMTPDAPVSGAQSGAVDAERPGHHETVSVPGLSLDRLVQEFRPSVLIADIEGGELDLFESSALNGVRTIIIELHPGVYGTAGQERILSTLRGLGFVIDADHLKGSVWVLHRQAVPALSPPGHRGAAPRIAIVTCMKNEGPFLLEWLAYHRAIGVTDFVIFTNDCTDGTDRMLDRLDAAGVVTHLPNPATLVGSTYFQPVALKYACQLPQVRRADYVMCIDVDEFVTIRAGAGRFSDLLQAAGPFHALSMSELNFTSSATWGFEDCWLTERFRDHETPTPGHWQARRGVKTIVHGIENIRAIQVHRPYLTPGTEADFVWLDGSGRAFDRSFTFYDPQNGVDRRGRYDLVCLNHYALRSVESYLLKLDRGDAVSPRNVVDGTYFRKRSIGGAALGWIDPMVPAARREWSVLMQDDVLAGLHDAAVAAHKARLSHIAERPEIAGIAAWIRETYFAAR
ncbi:FkbM family methyltransferase [Pseudooceanicola sediminis]|uniref:FkbM family methyltransferase n=1 Tax=Pseudooceanicola sediminis TaxID=2211117 RepID=A0A399J4V1_9RHOB|nr:FkbM family methyltransferase [Pseudooceanicola sediminis]KAA2317192.1 FkbM family methyltransferase [Puniceibacterium sp. HSS470]RII40458.1 FkbM family methyltransferase [Pseudooceanicola sediminis]|tara:strand:+ start:35986 stop:37746 length:1761 start_codon:yes stop_codon:yes gene_type:complete